MAKEEKHLTPMLFNNIEWVADGKVYRSEGAMKLARHVERIVGGQRDTYLMRTPKGSYFKQVHTILTIKLFGIGTSDEDKIEPLTDEEGIALYNKLPEKLIPMDEAFPGLEEA